MQFYNMLSLDDYRGMIIVGFVFQNLFEDTLGVISNTQILICRYLEEQSPSLGSEQCK